MVPPRCYVCDLNLRNVPDDGTDYFTLVCFGPTQDAKLADTRAMARLGLAGHPRNAVWFCNQHVELRASTTLRRPMSPSTPSTPR